MGDFRRVLEDDRIYLFDGAMGTMLYGRGVFINRCYDEVCLKDPDLVLAIHREYVKAGADILETNTFGATRPHLDKYGLGEMVEAINTRAAQLAREAAGDDVFVAGAIGPLGVSLEPLGPTSYGEARACFKVAATSLLAGGVDLFVLETFSHLREIEQAIQAVRELCDLPIVAQMTIQDDGKTHFGHGAADIARQLDAWGVDVVGLNCSVGPKPMLDAVEEIARHTARRLSAQPNAGMPHEVEGRKMYMASPDYLSKFAKRFIQKGVKFVGGCCGTTPEHIRLMADAVRAISPRQVTVLTTVAEPKPPPEVEVVPTEARSRLGARVSRGEFVSSVELLPPKGCDIGALLKSCAELKAAGVDCINVPDGPRAQSRMGVMAASVLIEQRVGIEAVVHYCCRDRNLLGMLSDLLGAQALGIRNLLLITGDPPKMGPYPKATAVFDIDAIGLAHMVNGLNHGLDIGGNPIGKPTSFFFGVGVNPGALDMARELRRFRWKVEAGASFAITQPVFDAEQFERFMEQIAGGPIPIIAGVWPLASYRNAEFLANEVPGVVIPPDILERMRRPDTPQAATAEGIAIAREMVERIRPLVRGIQVSAPFGRVPLALDVLRGYISPHDEVA